MCRILVIDDDSSALEALVGVLRAVGFMARGVASAESARIELGRNSYDVVIADYNLGAGAECGVHFLTWLQRTRPLVGRILCTGSVAGDNHHIGCEEILLQKPVLPEDLIEAITAVAPPISRH